MQNFIYFFLPKGISNDRATELFMKQMKEENPKQILDWVDEMGRSYACSSEVSLYQTIASAERGTSFVLWSLADLDCSLHDLRALLIDKRRQDSLMFRILIPKTVIDPDTAEALSMFDLMCGVEDVVKNSNHSQQLVTKGRITNTPSWLIDRFRCDVAKGMTKKDAATKHNISLKTVQKYTKKIEPHWANFFVDGEIAKDAGIKYENKKEKSFDMGKIFLPGVHKESEFFQVFYHFINWQRTSGTKISYWREWQDFTRWWAAAGDTPLGHPKDITERQAQRYLDYVKEHRDLAVSTLRRSFSILTCFYSFMQIREIVRLNPFKLLKLPYLSKGKITAEPFDPEDVTRILSYCLEHVNSEDSTAAKKAIWHRYFMVFFMMARSGCRVGAVFNLKKEDLKFTHGRGFLHLKAKKGDYYRVPIDRELTKALVNYMDLNMRDAPGHIRVFYSATSKAHAVRSIATTLKTILADLGIIRTNLTTHSFRTTFATQSYQSGMTLEELKMRLNHKDVNITLAYIKHVLDAPKIEWMNSVLELPGLESIVPDKVDIMPGNLSQVIKTKELHP